MDFEKIYYHICTTIDNEYVYFFSPFSGCLFCTNRNTGETKPVICLQMKRDFEYRVVFNYDDKIYLLPYNSNVMKVIDKDGTRCSDVVISATDESVGMTGCIMRGEQLFMYGRNEYIIVYNVRTSEISIINIEINWQRIHHEIRNCFWVDSYLLDGIIYIPTIHNEIIVIDQHNKLGYIRLVDYRKDILQNNICVTPCDIHSIFTEKDKTSWIGVYSFDGKLKEKQHIIIDNNNGELPFYTAVFSNKTWIIFPAKSDKICFVNGEIRNEKLNRRCTVFSAKLIDDKILAIEFDHGELIIVDARTGKIKEIELWMNSDTEKDVDFAIGKMIKSKNMGVNESQVYTLDRFIGCL